MGLRPTQSDEDARDLPEFTTEAQRTQRTLRLCGESVEQGAVGLVIP
jgi:hypothetical protein